MDDLAALNWGTNGSSSANAPAPSHPTLRPTPPPSRSGRHTPLSAQHSGLPQSRSQVPSPAADSFSGLLSITKGKQGSHVSLQEKQRQLLAEKSQQEAERRRQLAQEAQLWDALGSGKTTPEPSAQNVPAKPHSKIDSPSPQTDDDILFAFNAAAPVDSSTHFPAPQRQTSRPSPIAGASAEAPQHDNGRTYARQRDSGLEEEEDDDDPFGLGQMEQKSSAAGTPAVRDGVGGNEEDDDILGMLGKPVSELPSKQAPQRGVKLEEPTGSSSDDEPPFTRGDGIRDKAVADLVDMGFPAEKAAWALGQTPSGTDVQAAVGVLLKQAHSEARQKPHSRERDGASPSGLRDSARGRPIIGEEMEAGMPAWMRRGDDRGASQGGGRDGTSEMEQAEKDVARYASEIGTSFLKSANTLWKTGQKKVQRAVADLQQQDQDPSQPKWMRDAHIKAQSPSQEQRNASPLPVKATPQDSAQWTDEAILLESGGARPQRPTLRHQPTSYTSDSDARSRTSTPDSSRPHQRTQPRFAQGAPSEAYRMPATRITRQATEEQSAQAYVSPARRKGPSHKPADTSGSRPQPLDAGRPASAAAGLSATQLSSNNPFASKSPPTKIGYVPAPRRTPTPSTAPRPKAPARQIPPISSSTLSSSAAHRQRGTEAFKRGDFAAAHTSYTSSLGAIPPSHPVIIVILCNRALTSIKTGDPKAAIADADTALGVIGPSQGDGEKIPIVDVAGKEEQKDMKEFFGKALMRKAEALEHLEKWADAAATWRRAVEAGVGGSVAIQGRNRCETAVRPKPAPAKSGKATATKKPPSAPVAPSALGMLAGHQPAGGSAEAVKKLRAANAAAEKADNEKFALTDAVDARLVEWKGSKADNLRALLGSLDKVLWPEAGWTKVNMSDLVMPNKVKIVYMKAIAKVHPDKLSQSSTTEQRMVSAAVFSTLNEAWDKFKKDNNL